jgi:hypothetical protein
MARSHAEQRAAFRRHVGLQCGECLVAPPANRHRYLARLEPCHCCDVVITWPPACLLLFLAAIPVGLTWMKVRREAAGRRRGRG